MKDINKVIRQITLVSQFGLSLVVPILMCLLFCWYLTDRFQIGGWVYIPGFILGLGASAMTAYKLYLSVINKKDNNNKGDHPVSFNRHF